MMIELEPCPFFGAKMDEEVMTNDTRRNNADVARKKGTDTA